MTKLKYCKQHKIRDICSREKYSTFKLPTDECSIENYKFPTDECSCDKKKDCCQKITFDCKDLKKYSIIKSIKIESSVCDNIEYSILIQPILENCKVVGFQFLNTGLIKTEIKLVTVQTCTNTFELSKCEIDYEFIGEYKLPKSCDHKKLHEIQNIEFCIGIKDDGVKIGSCSSCHK